MSDQGGAFHVETAADKGHAELRLVGELDLSTVHRLDDAFREVQTGEARTIVVDMSKLEFIDSTGLNQLVVALKRQRLDGGDIVLRAPSERTRRVLDLVGLTSVSPSRDHRG